MTPRPLRFILVTDGSSDACLLHPIHWLLADLEWHEVDGEWADLRPLPSPAHGLANRLRQAYAHYNGEIILIHRDAESEPAQHRVAEINSAVTSLNQHPPYVCVVPVRMTEAWLLHDEVAIRRAAGNPNGKADLQLPRVSQIEALADPKETLRRALLDASETKGHRRKRKQRGFSVMRHRVAELIDDYGVLRGLSAFRMFETNLRRVLERL